MATPEGYSVAALVVAAYGLRIATYFRWISSHVLSLNYDSQ
jgi:hypothetical protein